MPNHYKGHDTAIAAFRSLPDDVRRNAELHLASFITPTTIDEPGVVAHNWTPAHAVPGFLRRMDVMLTPSRNETFSQAIVQGMLTGLPVVATPLPVFTEKLDTGAGIVCRTTEEFTAAMTQLARDPAERRRMGRLGRQTALERYAWSTDRFLDLYLFPSGRFGQG
jgi:glycosyltransferase involved in cell wall biosynthesis